MMRFLWIVLAVAIACGSLIGCETVKGGAQGFAKDVENTPKYAKGFWDKLKEADAWVQEHLW